MKVPLWWEVDLPLRARTLLLPWSVAFYSPTVNCVVILNWCEWMKVEGFIYSFSLDLDFFHRGTFNSHFRMMSHRDPLWYDAMWSSSKILQICFKFTSWYCGTMHSIMVRWHLRILFILAHFWWFSNFLCLLI
jgi:hypothetical protein